MLVGVAVAVNVAVAVAEIVGVEIGVYVSVGWFVFGGFGVGVDPQGRFTNVFVGIAVNAAVLVTGQSIVGVAVPVTGSVTVVGGNRVPVTNVAPGVRKALTHTGCVKMEGSTGSMKPFGLLVRKSLFGSRLESILAFNCQRGEKRSAHCPATSTHRNPITRIIGIIIQSRRSRSIVFMDILMNWQPHKDLCSRIDRFIVPGTFEPDASVMSIHNSACYCEPQARAASLKLGLAR